MPELSPNNLIWIDLEMTGLDPEKEKIIDKMIKEKEEKRKYRSSISVAVT